MPLLQWYFTVIPLNPAWSLWTPADTLRRLMCVLSGLQPHLLKLSSHTAHNRTDQALPRCDFQEKQHDKHKSWAGWDLPVWLHSEGWYLGMQMSILIPGFETLKYQRQQLQIELYSASGFKQWRDSMRILEVEGQSELLGDTGNQKNQWRHFKSNCKRISDIISWSNSDFIITA